MTYELQPFNQSRFDACMAWVARQFDRTLSQYEAVKIHALADALHVVQHHRPIIGGRLQKLKYGPVALVALNRVKDWKTDEDAPLKFSDKRGNALYFIPAPGPSRESMFTRSEQQAIVAAAKTVFSMTFDESQRFFHGECDGDDFLGKAWRKTKHKDAPISWNSILDSYAKQNGISAEKLKALVCV